MREFGGCGLSHWDVFAKGDGNTFDGQDGSRACEHVFRWAEDLDLIQNAGFSAYRFSFSWPRIQPSGRGKVNPTGLDFYDKLIDGMLEPIITLCNIVSLGLARTVRKIWWLAK